MLKVYKVAWSGLEFHVETFNTLKESIQFLDEHKEYSLIIKDHNEKTLKEQISNGNY